LGAWTSFGPLAVGASFFGWADAGMSLGEIVRKTEATYQQTQAFSARFRQWTTSSAARSTASTEASGTLYYQKPRQMHWQYDTPEPQIFVPTTNWLGSMSPRKNHIFVRRRYLFSSPLVQTFFDGILELRRHFEISLDSKQSTKRVAVLKLIPKKRTRASSRFFSGSSWDPIKSRPSRVMMH